MTDSDDEEFYVNLECSPDISKDLPGINIALENDRECITFEQPPPLGVIALYMDAVRGSGIHVDPHSAMFPFTLPHTDYDVCADLRGSAVCCIAPYAFYELCVETIHLPPCLMEIKEKAFFMCAELTEIVLPPSVSKLGYGVFMGCRGLLTLDLSACDIDVIPKHAFQDCTRLERVKLPLKGRTLEGGIFDNTRVERLSIPASYRKVPWAMAERSRIHTVTLLHYASIEDEELTKFENRGIVVIVPDFEHALLEESGS